MMGKVVCYIAYILLVDFTLSLFGGSALQSFWVRIRTAESTHNLIDSYSALRVDAEAPGF